MLSLLWKIIKACIVIGIIWILFKAISWIAAVIFVLLFVTFITRLYL